MKLALAKNQGQQEGGPVSEARTGKRFPLELPIKIHGAEVMGEASGITGNLSAAGVLHSSRCKSGCGLDRGI